VSDVKKLDCDVGSVKLRVETFAKSVVKRSSTVPTLNLTSVLVSLVLPSLFHLHVKTLHTRVWSS